MMRGVIPMVGHVIEELRAEFCDPASAPLGGVVNHIEHRPGADVALEGLFEGDCAGLVWVNVLRMFRTTDFPHESERLAPCRSARAAVIQVGAARYVARVDDHGYTPRHEDMEHDALVGLDDARRLEVAVCRAAKVAEDRGLVLGAVWSATEPVGPQGGVLAWVLSLTVQLA